MRPIAAPLLCALLGLGLSEGAPRSGAPPIVRGDARPSVGVFEASALVMLEERGLSLHAVLGAPGANARELARAPVYASLVGQLEADLAELRDRPKVGGIYAPNHAFEAAWLRDPRVHFELVGVVERLDRRVLEPGCGEARLVYRMALAPEGRPVTRLPMTMNVVLLQKDDGARCRSFADKWRALPAKGLERVDAVRALVAPLLPPARIEIDLQNLHGPAFKEEQDDHAEYLLRSFDVAGGGVKARPLVGTPRDDLEAGDRDALAAWVREHFAQIDRGTWVVPERFLATRAISVAPRGVARPRNRPFARLFDASAFAGLPYDQAALVRSPRALLRRLDGGTCQGCHESRAVAGFHLLGDERDPDAAFNALAFGRSNHLNDDLAWREEDLARVAAGQPDPLPRPFAERGRADVWGVHCGLGDPGFASWTCPPGLRCRDIHHDEVGVCVGAKNEVGDPCEDARITMREIADGDRIDHAPREACDVEGEVRGLDACNPNTYGFPGGMCTASCSKVGERVGLTICADLPATGYETECFLKTEPIERCLLTHFARRRVRACDEAHPCRDDFACARVPGAPPGTGACVPPYFVFQARVDGPVTDR